MYLTALEEKMYDGEFGEWVSKAMKLIVKLGEIQNAEKLIPIGRAHVSGVSYKTAGKATIQLLEDMANKGVKVKAFTTLNPAGMDLKYWKEMGVSDEFAKMQLRLINAFRALGIVISLTCAPYFFENRPKKGEVVAFAESSAIIISNSLLGARTNRHGSLDALSAAIVGRVPLSGLLLDENRKANFLVEVPIRDLVESDFGLIGLYLGNMLKPDDIPAFVFDKPPLFNELRFLGAALAASGALAMFHVIGITPEAKTFKQAFGDSLPEDRLVVSRKELEDAKQNFFEEFNDADAVFIGCPHASMDEINDIAKMLSNKKVREGVKFWIFTSRLVLSKIRNTHVYETLIKAGVRIYTDTCMVVSPIEDLGITRVLTNSSKAAWYIPKFSSGKIKINVKSIKEIIELVSN